MAIERFTDNEGRLFIKAPLINNLKNQRGWRATEEANERYARSVINKPVTIMYDKAESRYNDYHPFALPTVDPATGMVREPEAVDHVKFAARYGYGIAREVSTGSKLYKAASGEIPWFFTFEVIDPTLREELLKDDTPLVPPAFSPGILHIEGPDDAISEYEIVHVATVPQGAFGPRFVKLSKCAGDAMTCLPQLKAASYKERAGICPKDAFSSLLTKAASSNDNMSLQGVEPPAPTQPTNPQAGRTADNSPVKPQNQPNQGQQNQDQGFKKPTIRITRLNKQTRSQSQSTEPRPDNGNGEGKGEGGNENGDNNEGENNNSQGQQGKNQSELQRIKELERRVKEGDTRYFVEGILRDFPHLFSTQSGRYNPKKYQEKVQEYTQKIMNGELSPEMAQRLIQLEAKVPMLETVKRASSPIEDFLAPAIEPKGASSLEDDEPTHKSKMLGSLFRDYLGIGGV